MWISFQLIYVRILTSILQIVTCCRERFTSSIRYSRIVTIIHGWIWNQWTIVRTFLTCRYIAFPFIFLRVFVSCCKLCRILNGYQWLFYRCLWSTTSWRSVSQLIASVKLFKGWLNFICWSCSFFVRSKPLYLKQPTINDDLYEKFLYMFAG